MEYKDRDIEHLDERGGYYSKHVMAMTKEGLHDKMDIAAELAYRDCDLDAHKEAIETLQEKVASMEAVVEAAKAFVTTQSLPRGYDQLVDAVDALAKEVK